MASDNAAAVKKLIHNNFDVERFYDDMMEVPVAEMPSCDFYTCGFPCQPYSSAGQNKGLDDDRAVFLGPYACIDRS